MNSPLNFYGYVSPSQELREAANEAEALIKGFSIEASLRLDVQKAKEAAEAHLKESGEWDKLTPESQRLVQKMLLDGKRNGLTLPEKERNEYAELNKQLTTASIEFNVSMQKCSLLPFLTLVAVEKFQ